MIILLLVVLCGASIIGVLYNYFNKQYVTSLDQAAGYIAEGVDLAGMDFLTNLNEKEKRITWVAADGTVLYDNKADISTMETTKPYRDQAGNDIFRRNERPVFQDAFGGDDLSCDPHWRWKCRPCLRHPEINAGSFDEGFASGFACITAWR